MRYIELEKSKKLYLNYSDIANILGISPESARVTCTRWVKKGALIRIKRGVYILASSWRFMERAEKFVIANILQNPSYISLTTAMDYYEITTQMQQNFTESISIYRTKEVQIQDDIFSYTKIRKELYFGFEKKDDIFIAAPEKAFLDALYLKSIGRYDFDITAVDAGKLDKAILESMIKKYPDKTRKRYESIK